MRKRFGLRLKAAGLTTIIGLVALLFLGVGVALAVTGAVSTTDNPGYTGPSTYENQACLNGHGVNCNIYVDKRDVWLSGLPLSASLGEGTYFFEVNVPGGQPTPNDGGTKNLSDTFDAPYASGALNGDGSSIPSGDNWTNREFSVAADGTITYGGTHQFDSANNKIQVFPYDDTTNNGGVYILAVCKVPTGATATGTGTPGIDPRDCKYDAFKVQSGGSTCDPNTDPNCGTPPALDLSASKTAAPAFTRTFTWSITKSACAHGVSSCKTTVDASGGSVVFDYTVKATEDSGTDSAWTVAGVITVDNVNLGAASNVVVTDAIDNGGSCAVHTDTVLGLDPTGDTLPGASEAQYPYSCTFSSNPSGGTNTATVTWDPTLSDGSITPDGTTSPTRGYTFGDPTNVVGNCVTVTDNFNSTGAQTLATDLCGDGTHGTLSSTPAVGASWTAPTWTLTYSRSIGVVADQCKSYLNTATFSGAGVTSGLKGSDSATVTICGPAAGGLTMGFWQNKNGQGLITNTAYSGSACSALIAYLTGFNPFSDLKIGTKTYASTCVGIASYVYDTIKAATCSSTDKTCNTMLKAQMLATALDVYFSDPTHGDPIKGFNGNNTTSLGGLKVDLTNICKMIDGSGGGGTCNGTYGTGAAFGAPPGSTCQTVSALLAYAASQSNVGGTSWYGQAKAMQVLAKDTFDSINNQAAFTC